MMASAVDVVGPSKFVREERVAEAGTEVAAGADAPPLTPVETSEPVRTVTSYVPAASGPSPTSPVLSPPPPPQGEGVGVSAEETAEPGRGAADDLAAAATTGLSESER